MIHFLLARSNRFTIQNYKNIQGAPVSRLINVLLYEDISSLNQLPCQALIFADFERLDTGQLQLVKKIASEFSAKYPDIPIYNNPHKVLPRYALLKKLHEMGINNFTVYRLDEPLNYIRYPVFLREENEHTGALTRLIHYEDQLHKNVLYLKLLGYAPKDLMIVEFCDASDEKGLYHKFAAFRFGDKILPKNYDRSPHWIVKAFQNSKLNNLFFDDLENFLIKNPHHEWLESQFNTAGIDYGRADYAQMGDRLQLWEINPNPSFGNISPAQVEEMKKDSLVDYKYLVKYRQLALPFHESLHDEFRRLSERKPIFPDLESCKGIDKEMEENRKRMAMRTFHMWLEAKRSPYRQMAIGFRYMVRKLAGFLYRLGKR